MHGIEIERIRKIDRINWSWTRNWKAAVASIKPGIITLEVAGNIMWTTKQEISNYNKRTQGWIWC